MRIALLLVVSGCSLFAQGLHSGRDYGRSITITRQGIVATTQILASQAGAQILARGGSAVDAAIAANAVLSVVEPMMDGPGGDCFAIYRDAKTGKLTGLNASGPAPRALTPEFLTGQGIKTMPRHGINAVSVPGAVDGWWMMHQRFGKLAWSDLFQSAIALARDGFPVSQVIHEAWNAGPVLKVTPESTALFLPNGKVPAEGQIFRNPDLARALQLLAAKGRDAFYKGEIAAAILKTSHRLKGAMTAEDLASYSSEWVEPISIDYRGWRIYELPPNGQGMAALEMLNLMETFPVSPLGALSAAEFHKRIESMKLAYSDLYHYDADPRTNHVPVEQLLSKSYAKKRAALIDPAKANCSVKPGEIIPSDTTYLAVVDREGNMVSWIQSISSAFGSGVVVDGMGFELQNRAGTGFNLDPKSPTVLAGGKRPFHTIIPAFMERGDENIAFGIMGGANQPQAHAQFVSNFVDYGMDLQQALEAPRFTKPTPEDCRLAIESRVPPALFQQLSELGHWLIIRRPYTQEMGRGNAVMRNSDTKTNYGASDPRADGAALPEPLMQ